MWGGGIHCNRLSAASVLNCTFTQNSASNGGALYCDDSVAQVTNCILWNDAPKEIGPYITSAVVSHSCVQGGFSGDGNFDADPLLIVGVQGSFYLSQTPAGQMDNSPCIDSGNAAAESTCFEISGNRVCMNQLWTRTDGITDFGQVDAGAHYPLPGRQHPDVRINMPSHHFSPGETSSCEVIVTNLFGNLPIRGYPLFVILGMGDTYLFAPASMISISTLRIILLETRRSKYCLDLPGRQELVLPRGWYGVRH